MDIAARFAAALSANKVRSYRKSAEVDIRPAIAGEVVKTVIDGAQETVNTAKPGDYVVRGVKGECYIISTKTLTERYGSPLTDQEAGGYRRYPAKGNFYGFCYEGEPFEFVAPWGEKMIANPGDFIGTTAIGSNEYYRIEKEVFAATYIPGDT